MTKVVELKLDGNLEKGLKVNLAISPEGAAKEVEISGNLPPAPQLKKIYDDWQSNYRSLGLTSRISGKKIAYDGSIQKNTNECAVLSKQLKQQLNDWLNASQFQPIWRKYLEKVAPDETVRILIRTIEPELRKLPWHLWKLLENYPKAEIALAANEYERLTKDSIATEQEQISILAILGNSRGINIKADKQLLIKTLTNADITFLYEPQREEICQELWQKKWDILFFAGHSRTEHKTGRIFINQKDSLSLEELSYSLKKAVNNGLKLAIFNSCDGLGLANFLEELNLPQIIVMREPVPDYLAHQFLKDFLTHFASGEHFYLAVKQARERLQGLEKNCPGASWLPIIVQNPATIYPTWWSLGGIPPNPYRGLSAFCTEDARFFFGREHFTSKLVTRVQQDAMVAVIGASGSGKSSVVFAGLIPELKQQQPVKFVCLRPGNKPFTSLALALSPLDSGLLALETEIELDRDSQSLTKMVDRFVGENLGQRFVLVIDQFEELYTLSPPTEQRKFLDLLLDAIENAANFCLVLTLRADFLGCAIECPRFADALQNNNLLLGPMLYEELERAIFKPASLFDVKFEAGLCHKIITNLAAAPEKLPLLEFTLTQLWFKQKNARLSHQNYREIGGVEAALAQYAEIVYTSLSETERLSAQRIFIQLVSIPEDGSEATRRLATRTEVKDWELVVRLADKRLVVTNRDLSANEETVEIIHEALIRNWKRLQKWIDRDRSFRLWQEQLRWACRQWEKSDRDPTALLRGKALYDAEHWQSQRSSELSAIEKKFIALSLTEQKQQQTKQKRQQQFVIFGLSAGLILALNLTQNALINEIKAINSSAELLLDSGKYFEALLKSLKASKKLNGIIGNLVFFASGENKKELKQDNNILLQEALYKVREKNRLEGSQGSIDRVKFSPDGKILATNSSNKTIQLWNFEGKLIKTFAATEGKEIRDVSFSPDGQKIATKGEDKYVKIWNTKGQLINSFQADNKEIYEVIFSPDGQKIATKGKNNYVKIWTTQGQLINSFQAHQNQYFEIIFSPDSQKIATFSKDKTVIIWNLQGEKLQTLKENKDEISKQEIFVKASFSPDSKTIAVFATDGIVTLWNLQGEKLQTLEGHRGWIWDIAFSPDSQTIATASADYTLKLWRKDPNSQKFKLIHTHEHPDSVTSVAFSPDGQTIATGCSDRNARLWNLHGEKIQTLKGHTDWVWDVTFSPDGKMLASASKDKTVKLWQIKGKKFKIISAANQLGINSLSSFSPNGKIIAIGSGDGTIKLWSRQGELIKTIPAHTDIIEAINFSPDGKIIATGSRDKTVKLWTRDGQLLKTLTGHKDSVTDLSFSPDGKILATASGDNTIKLWTREGQLLKTLTGHKDSVLALNFSPDGKIIATTGWDGNIKLWSRNGRLIKTFIGHNDGIHSIVFSPDGEIIASGSEDMTIKLWTREGQFIKTISGHTGPVRSIVFSPDGEIIASGSEDTTIKLWTLNGKLIKTDRGHDEEVQSLSFSPDGQILVSGDRIGKLIFWNLSLNPDRIANSACSWVYNYLTNNPHAQKYRGICSDLNFP